MAIDTRNKRLAAAGIDLPTIDGVIGTEDRRLISGVYPEATLVALGTKVEYNAEPNSFSKFSGIGSHTVNSSLSSVVTLTSPANATKILIQALTQNVRYTIDGTTPTATTGFQLSTTFGPVILEVDVLKVIEETGSATIQYQWLA